MKKIYTVILEEKEDGKVHFSRYCDGFEALELLGILELIQIEISQQIQGDFKPDFVKREVVVDEDL